MTSTPYVEYFGLGMDETELVKSQEFRDVLTKHGFELHDEDSNVLSVDQEFPEHAYVYVHDPASNNSLAVLYDDEAGIELTHHGFIEVLQLLDDYSKRKFQSRAYMYMGDDDELDCEVGEDHPYYGKAFDFATGDYKE